MALLASLLTLVMLSPSDGAAALSGDDDRDLHRQEHRLDRRISASKLDLDEISTRLVRAQGRVDSAVLDLRAARARLAGVRDQVREAEILDAQLQERLELAIARLENARGDLVDGREDVRDSRSELASYAVSNYQNGGAAMFNLGVAFESRSAEEALDTMQAAGTVLDKQSAALQQLEVTKVLLQLTEQRVEQTRDAVASRRQDAADHLAVLVDLRAQAIEASTQVENRVASLRLARAEIAAAKRTERSRLSTLQRERDRVQDRLRQIAIRRARQHARMLARQRARELRLERRLERQQERQQERRQQIAAAPPAVTDDGGFLRYPVNNTYITSSYGMRMHPILEVYKLHDGTDFHAPCGRAVYAAASGRVMAEYYNAGYGNRIILDHGFVRGVSLQTSYNHLTRFVAGPGQRVSRGQLIGYSGTTGYSTACHMHFMVYVNGYTANPIRWL